MVVIRHDILIPEFLSIQCQALAPANEELIAEGLTLVLHFPEQLRIITDPSKT